MKSPAHEESGGSPLLAVETVWRDIARGVRHLWRKPAFTLAAVISLGLGIGANTLIFGVLNGTLLKPLAVQDPDRLVVVWTVPDQNAPEQLSTSSVSRYFHFRDHSRSFESVAAFNGAACGVRTLGFDRAGVPVERIFGQTVSPSLFRVLGVVPLLGRTFTDAEDQVDNVAPVALLTYRSWQRRFSADQGIVGKIISLNRTPTTIIGVLRPEFDLFGDTVEFVAPLCLTRAQVEGRLGGNTIIARLKSGVSTAQAQAEADAIAASLAVADPERHRGFGIRIESLQRAQARILDRSGQPASDVGFPLLILQGAVAFVLLIACANVAGLLLARATGRLHEVAIRLTVGATRTRVIRQLVTESVPLAIIGGLVGVVLSWTGLRLFVRWAPPDLPRLGDVSVDARTLAFTAAIVVLTSVLCTLLPAITASRVPLTEPLRDSRRTSTGNQRGRTMLVMGQIALALVLLTGAGLMIRSFIRAATADGGGDPRNLLVFDFRLLPAESYRPLPQQHRGTGLWLVNDEPALRFERVLERLQSVPGVVSAAAVSMPPFGGLTMDVPFNVEGQAAQRVVERSNSARDVQTAHYFAVTRGFFSTMRIPLVSGREFDGHDIANQLAVAIINQTMARAYFGQQNPLGQRIKLDFVPDEPSREIVGVVGDSAASPLQSAHVPAIYVPHLQQTPMFAGLWVYFRTGMYFVVRTSGEPMRFAQAIKNAVAEVDRNTPAAEMRGAEQSLDEQLRYMWLYMLLLGVFGVVALVLAATGVYGVMAYAVAERTREIGIRMALGARATDVLIMTLRHAASVVAIGATFGILGAFALVRLIQSLLFGVSPTDPITYAATLLLLVVIAGAAAFVPAWRAATVNPTVALKYE